MQCVTHLKEVLYLPCLEYQDSKWLERCPGCNSWRRAKDQLSNIGRPVDIESNCFLRGRQTTLHLMTAYANHARIDPPKPESCLEYEIPGWDLLQHAILLVFSELPRVRELWRNVFLRKILGLRPLCGTDKHLYPMSSLRPSVLHYLFLHRPKQQVRHRTRPWKTVPRHYPHTVSTNANSPPRPFYDASVIGKRNSMFGGWREIGC